MEKIRKKSSGKRAGSVSLWLLLCLACLLLLGGCRKKEEVHPTAGEDGVYQIYYLNSTRTGLASVSYQTETTDAEILIGELAGQILAAPENPEYQAVLSDKVEFLDINRDNNVLTLNFNQEYMNMKASREILCRAALTKTMTQVEGVDYISIYVADQPLLHRDSVAALTQLWRAHPDKIAALGHDGVRGNPCLFPARLFGELMALTGDRGGSSVIRCHEEDLILLDVPAEELTDVDTPQALEALKQSD